MIDHIHVDDAPPPALPSAWRAAVGKLRNLLCALRAAAEKTSGQADPDTVVNDLFSVGASPFYDHVRELHLLTAGLEASQGAAARHWASTALLDLVVPSPIYRRAYEKPQGYAGDFELINLFHGAAPAGATVYGRLVHRLAQNHTLSRTVVARTESLGARLDEVAARCASRPVRILSLACGPAVEIQRFVERTAVLTNPVEFLLVDQDPAALTHARDAIVNRIGQRPIRVSIHPFSVRQLLRPKTDADLAKASEVFGGLDYAYATGLYDYLSDPVAFALTQRLVDGLAPGGRLTIANLGVAEDSTWLMDHVLDWSLIYRGEADLAAIASRLIGVKRSSITTDPTGHCFFLDVERDH